MSEHEYSPPADAAGTARAVLLSVVRRMRARLTRTPPVVAPLTPQEHLRIRRAEIERLQRAREDYLRLTLGFGLPPGGR